MKNKMNGKCVKAIRLMVGIFIAFASGAMAQQYQMPQDNWTYGGLRINGSFGAIAVGPDGNIYASASGGTVAVFDRNGVPREPRGTNLNIHGIALDSATNLYVLDGSGTNVVLKFSVDGELIRTFATRGTNEDQVIPSAGPPSSLTIGSNDQVYVLDAGNKRVQVYDKNGNHLFHWGGNAGNVGGLLGRFTNLEGIAALPNGEIAVQNGWNCCSDGVFNIAWEIQLFGSSGAPIAIKPRGQKTAYLKKTSLTLAASPDGLLAMTHSYYFPPGGYDGFVDLVQVLPGDSAPDEYLTQTHSTAILRSDGIALEVASIAFGDVGTMYISYGGGIHSARRHYNSGKYTTNSPPLPYILSAAQRPNSSLVDIDYQVVSKTSTNVSMGLLVFIYNGNDFANLRVPHALMENTATNLGANRPANVVQRTTWDASELATSFVNLQFEVLAKDDRGLLPLSFVTVPASGIQTNFTMSRVGVADSDLLSVWYWLLATNHPAIVLTDGLVREAGGLHAGEALTGTGVNTTDRGRDFLYELLGVRRPTTEEIARANSGSYGIINANVNNVVKQ